MFEIFRKEVMWGGRRLILETGKIARQGRWRRHGDVWRDDGAGAPAVAKPVGEAGAGFLPADRQLPGKDLRRRQDSRAASSSARGRAVGKKETAGLAP